MKPPESAPEVALDQALACLRAGSHAEAELLLERVAAWTQRVSLGLGRGEPLDQFESGAYAGQAPASGRWRVLLEKTERVLHLCERERARTLQELQELRAQRRFEECAGTQVGDRWFSGEA